MLEESPDAFNRGSGLARALAGRGHGWAEAATVPKRGQGGPLVRPALLKRVPPGGEPGWRGLCRPCGRESGNTTDWGNRMVRL